MGGFMVRRDAILLCWLLLPGCRQLLDIPSDLTADEGVADAQAPGSGPDGGGPGQDAGGGTPDGGSDGGGGGDGGGCVTSSVAFDFADRSALEGWQVDTIPPGAGCTVVVESGQLAMYQTTSPAVCSASRELGLDMVGDSSLAVALADAGAEQMNMSFRMVLSDATGDIRHRRQLSIDRDDGLIRFGDCTEKGCESHGSVAFDQSEHARWRFFHDSAAGAVYFEVAPPVGRFTRPDGFTPVDGLAADLVQCVGVELGTFENTPGTNGRAAFDDLIGGPDRE
jgi:hypothetical protein